MSLKTVTKRKKSVLATKKSKKGSKPSKIVQKKKRSSTSSKQRNEAAKPVLDGFSMTIRTSWEKDPTIVIPTGLEVDPQALKSLSSGRAEKKDQTSEQTFSRRGLYDGIITESTVSVANTLESAPTLSENSPSLEQQLAELGQQISAQLRDGAASSPPTDTSSPSLWRDLKSFFAEEATLVGMILVSTVLGIAVVVSLLGAVL